jgi:Tfp pilus assembly protein PilV
MTMIEVLVALLIATVGLVGALAMAASMLAGNTSSRRLTESLLLAQSKLEEQQVRTPVPGAGADAAASDQCDLQLNCSNPSPASCVDPTACYTRSVSWGPLSPDGLSMQVNVFVSWTDSGGKAHGITVTDQRVK